MSRNGSAKLVRRQDKYVEKYRDIVVVKAKTAGQRNYILDVKNNDITFCVGPAGTGKTAVSIGLALQYVLSPNPAFERIVIMRPVRPACGESIGFLPGDMQSKMAPWAAPVVDNMKEFIDDSQIKNLFYKGLVEIIPLAFARGRSLNRSFIIVDEAQNCNLESLRMILTRIGEGSKMVVNGDLAQSDVGSGSGLSEVINRLEGMNGIAVCELGVSDIVRHHLIGEILKRLDSNVREDEYDVVHATAALI